MKFKDLIGSKNDSKQSKMKMIITESQMKRLIENVVDENVVYASRDNQNKSKQIKSIINETK